MTSCDISPSAVVWAGPPLTDGAALLIVMHGYGANEHDLVPVLDLLPGEFTAACLRAPLDMPAPYGDGAAWFPIEASPGSPRLDIADAATAAVWDWLATVRATVQPGPIVLLGFSQGGAMVTHLLRHYPGEFAAGVVLSGFTVPGAVAGDARLRAHRPGVLGLRHRRPDRPARRVRAHPRLWRRPFRPHRTHLPGRPRDQPGRTRRCPGLP